MTLKLRTYQQQSVDSVFKYWNDKKGNNPLIVLPTAAGKSLVQADFALSCFNQYNKVRILCVTHVKELVEQNELEMLEYWKDAPTGAHAASLKRREDTQILFASIQSIYKKAFDFDPFDIVCVDECFTGDTLISTINGQKRIDEIDPEIDYVYCVNEKNNNISIDKPIKLAQNGTKDISLLSFNDGSSIKCTSTHLIYTQGLWVQAEKLKIGAVVNILDFQRCVLIKLLRASVAVAKKLFQMLSWWS